MALLPRRGMVLLGGSLRRLSWGSNLHRSIGDVVGVWKADGKMSKPAITTEESV